MSAFPLLDPSLPLTAYREVDLSTKNPDLGQALQDADSCQQYLKGFLTRTGGLVAFGGYLEKRRLYTGFKHFQTDRTQSREYHLGIDFWAPSGTGVHAPWAGTIHSWANRALPGDYGPVVILEHNGEDGNFYSLYGHLSLPSLMGLSQGKPIQGGQCLGHLGTPHENGGYAPHLHFQIIRDLQGLEGDYPGVCTRSDLPFYSQNCPDPLPMLGFF